MQTILKAFMRLNHRDTQVSPVLCAGSGFSKSSFKTMVRSRPCLTTALYPKCKCLLFLAVVLVSATACKVEHVPKIAVIEGNIITRGTTSPATTKPLKMGLFEQRGQGGMIFPNSYYVLLHEFYSDDKGRFKLTYPLETIPSSYKVEIIEPVEGHFRSDHNKILRSNVVNLLSMELHPHSWLKFVIDNPNGGQYDYFSFVIEGYDRLSHTGNSVAWGYFLVPGADSLQIVFNDHRHRPLKQQIYKVFVKGQDTTEHVVVIPPL